MAGTVLLMSGNMEVVVFLRRCKFSVVVFDFAGPPTDCRRGITSGQGLAGSAGGTAIGPRSARAKQSGFLYKPCFLHCVRMAGRHAYTDQV